MESIKIKIFGSDGYTCQIPRIKEAMENLGYLLSSDSPDIIYANDPPGYVEALSLKKKLPKAFLIFNLLDIPWHIPKINEKTKRLVEKFLIQADAVTVISNKVKNEQFIANALNTG